MNESPLKKYMQKVNCHIYHIDLNLEYMLDYLKIKD